mmetsp:Transcript_15581/g.23355  ORF Transcript_15581/g.23355 Transcript_15581/m.23355 type:complete len:111 (+) Transcript_15581:554-886(+)
MSIKRINTQRRQGRKRKCFHFLFWVEIQLKRKIRLCRKPYRSWEKKERQKRNQTFSHSEIDINYVKCANLFAWEFFRNLPLPEDHGREKEGDEQIRDYFSSEIQTRRGTQ